MSQVHYREIAVSDIASASLNTPVDPSKSPIFVQAPRELPYSEPTVWCLKRQLYGLRDAPKSRQAHFSQIMVSKGMVQMKSDPCAFLEKDQMGHVQLAVMAYVDDLFTSGSAQIVKEFISMIHEEFPLKHVNFLTSENPAEFLGRTIKRLKNGNITMEFHVNPQSTGRTQASIAHSSAENEFYAMTQAAVESLASKNFVQEFSSAILSSSVSIVTQTDSSAGKSIASRLGISRRAKHIELKYLWIQDEVKEGKLELKKVGTHFNPSDVLTNYVPASVLGPHLPRLNIFKDNSQRSKSVQSSAKPVQVSQPHPHSTSSITPVTLSVFTFSFNNYDQQEALHQIQPGFKKLQ